MYSKIVLYLCSFTLLHETKSMWYLPLENNENFNIFLLISVRKAVLLFSRLKFIKEV